MSRTGSPRHPRPLVAVTGQRLHAGRVERWASPALGVLRPYLEAVRRAGGFEATVDPVPIDVTEAAELLHHFDALVLTGGPDVEPARYGEAPHPQTYGVNPDADAFECSLALAALEVDLPVLAICRGLQVLNVALGGTLHQHLPDLPGLEPHGVPNVDDDPELHAVSLEPGSRLDAAMGVARPSCSSHHHQAVDRLGERLRITAWADDGVVEGLEVDGAWVLAVQWHPEDTAAADPAQQGLFDALVAEAARRRPPG